MNDTLDRGRNGKYELSLRVEVQSDTSPMGGNLTASMKITNAYAL